VGDVRIEESILDDGHELSTNQIFEYLGNVMYAKRTKMDPLWNTCLVAGWDTTKNEPYVSFLFYLLPSLP